MVTLKKIILIVLTIILAVSTQNNFYIASNADTRAPANVDVIQFDFNDPYMSLVRQSLENIQKENENKVKFTFYDSKNNQSIQNATIDNLINEGNSNLLLVNLVNVKEETIKDIINKVKPKNIPIIFFNIEPEKTDIIKSYPKSIIITTDSKQSGILQGDILVDLWNKNKEAMDKNNDNIMQYIMLRGQINSVAANERTKYSISTINEAGIKTQELASTTGDWSQEAGRSAIESLFLKYSNNIEAIISNNDAMAIGAVEALQKYGYNKGDAAKTIPVVGIDGLPTAKDLIEKGFMAGTVVQNPDDLANALYTIGMNLVFNKDPLEDTTYKFEKEGVIKLPYSKYMR